MTFINSLQGKGTSIDWKCDKQYEVALYELQ